MERFGGKGGNNSGIKSWENCVNKEQGFVGMVLKRWRNEKREKSREWSGELRAYRQRLQIALRWSRDWDWTSRMTNLKGFGGRWIYDGIGGRKRGRDGGRRIDMREED
jgi:hypothetical protein